MMAHYKERKAVQLTDLQLTLNKTVSSNTILHLVLPCECYEENCQVSAIKPITLLLFSICNTG